MPTPTDPRRASLGAKWVWSALVWLAAFGCPASAQTLEPEPPIPAVALSAVPHVAGCDDFRRVGKATWAPVVPIKINGGITLGLGVFFTEGIFFAGVDIAHVLNTRCGATK